MYAIQTALPYYHRPYAVPVPVPVLAASPSAAFDNRGGTKEIEASGLDNSGDFAKINIGTSAMDNSLGGTHKITVDNMNNSGYGAVTNIGLQNLASYFDNRGGERHVNVENILNGGTYAKMNIGRMAMDNTMGGQSNIGVRGMDNTGYGAEMNIGLQELPFDNRGGQRHVNVENILNGGTYARMNIGRMAMDNSAGGQSNIGVRGMDNTGYGAEMNIGLENLALARFGAAPERGGPSYYAPPPPMAKIPANPTAVTHTEVDAFANTGFKGGVAIGGSDMQDGEYRTLHIGEFTDNGFKNNNELGHKDAQQVTIDHITSAGQKSVTEIFLI